MRYAFPGLMLLFFPSYANIALKGPRDVRENDMKEL